MCVYIQIYIHIYIHAIQFAEEVVNNRRHRAPFGLATKRNHRIKITVGKCIVLFCFVLSYNLKIRDRTTPEEN
jgi:hypothetical protein